MISVVFLVFAIVLIVIGGLFGFKRGIVNEGVRLVLWVVLFVGSCLFIPGIADRLLLILAESFEITAENTEQLAAELISKIEWLKEDTYLVLPLASMLRSLLVPIITVLCFWGAWLVSGILYLVAHAVFLKNIEFGKAMYARIASLAVGIVISLFGGMLTLYPAAQLSDIVNDVAGVVRENEMLAQEIPEIESLEGSYAGTPVQILYRYTGMEWLADNVHSLAIHAVIEEDGQNGWTELPKLVHLGNSALDVYGVFVDTQAQNTSLEDALKDFTEDYFLLDFITEEQKITLLKHLKEGMANNLGNETTEKLLGWIEVQKKEQIINDAAVYGALYDLLKEEGMLDFMADGQGNVVLSQEFGDKLLQKLYELSNAETVIPEFLNTVYATLMAGEAEELLLAEALVFSEQMKMDVEEVVDVMCSVSDLLVQADSLTPDEKMEVLNSFESLKDNEAVGDENYAELLDALTNMLD